MGLIICLSNSLQTAELIKEHQPPRAKSGKSRSIIHIINMGSLKIHSYFIKLVALLHLCSLISALSQWKQQLVNAH